MGCATIITVMVRLQQIIQKLTEVAAGARGFGGRFYELLLQKYLYFVYGSPRAYATVSLAVMMALMPTLVVLSANPLLAVSRYCVSEKCKEAEAAEAEAATKAAEANSSASTLEGEVQRLNAEISALEAKIVANQAVADDLAEQITVNQAKLKEQQAALAEILVDSHFEEQPDTVMVLAGSSSISDYAEKQSRLDTVETQINYSAQNIKNIKEKLEAQKIEVDRILEDERAERQEIAAKRQEQTELITKYQNDAAAYAEEAEAARKIQAEEIAAEIAKYNSTGTIVDSGINSYPYKDRCPADNLRFSAYGGYGCQCTSYAGYKAYERWRVSISAWGDAKNWVDSAEARHYAVDQEPEIHTVAVNTRGVYGHVMWVEAVHSNGTITVSEYNYIYANFSVRTGVSTSGLYFIHFN